MCSIPGSARGKRSGGGQGAGRRQSAGSRIASKISDIGLPLHLLAAIRLDASLAVVRVEVVEKPAQHAAPRAPLSRRFPGARADRLVFVATGCSVDQLVERNGESVTAGRAEQDQPGQAHGRKQATDEAGQEQQEQQQALFHAQTLE